MEKTGLEEEERATPKGRAATAVGVAEWYAGRGVLVTGGSGFMGKALLEKLLRSCPGVAVVYLLLRSKEDRSPRERIATLVKNRVFDRLRREQGDSWIEKLRVVEGDVCRQSLGLSEKDRETLERGDGRLPGVSVVFHCAATVRFDEEIRKAVLLNTKATREVVRLGCTLPSLKSFVHVSTAFCHIEHAHIEEVIYSSHVDHNRVIEFAEKEGDDTLENMAPRLLKGFPNTYLFSKSLAEQVINDAREKIPAVIYRPSVVCPALEEPFPGWVQSANGPMGVLKGALSGVIRSVYGDGDLLTDLLPVDKAVAALLVIAWRTGTKGHSEEDRNRVESPLPVYHGATGDEAPISWNQFLDNGRLAHDKYPHPRIFWYPDGGIYKSRILHVIFYVLFQLLPAILVDALLILKWKKPCFLKLQLHIFTSMRSIEFFLSRPWSFDNRNLRELHQSLSPEDASLFNFSSKGMDYHCYLERWMLGVRRYMMMASDESLPIHRKYLRRLFWAHMTLKGVLWLAVAWIVTYTIGACGGMEKVTASLPCTCISRGI